MASRVHLSKRDEIIGAFSSLYGLWYGVQTYLAPNQAFGPNGATPLYGKTSLASNDLDPITAHYLHAQGATLITLILSWFLFARGNGLVQERAMIRMFLSGHAATLAVGIRTIVMEDFGDGEILEGPFLFFYGMSFLHVLWLSGVLRAMPTKIIAASGKYLKITTAEKASNIIMTIYIGSFCVSRLLFGPSHKFFPSTPLESNNFDPLMMYVTRITGAWFVPFVVFLLFDSWKVPALGYKIMCFFTILCLPGFFVEFHEDSGHLNKNAFIGLAIGNVCFLFLGFSLLGAFKKDEALHIRNMKASKAA